ncbi:metal ABC transporter ATP-binding protein [Salinibacterium sp. UTAS2018]|uniref:metal ABC transporter ATP-binding protein n=1 Tax=Salinibacterium sp. UTAS2018 TaxID=2508880 RepID=UPI0010096FA6|nr:metal ABC transporter ATP-binding protein [Salinibacterium sp. UTAS2018]QAV70634.1 metal ABC transporter ATP-binding protein [Salinibacterium sp. UTAS2018]
MSATATTPASAADASASAAVPVLSIRDGVLGFGARTLWSDLNLDVAPGEFLAILGANGSGKSSLLKTILGQQKLDSGTITVAGHPVRRGDRCIGYIPQQKLAAPGTPLRGRDLVTLGVNGHRFGFPTLPRAVKDRVDELIADVGATSYAGQPLGSLSGGEQQRLRVAQSLAADPVLLLCDEPLLSLDLQHQRGVSELIDRRRREHDTAVIFVTHDVNPILSMVDRILYLAGGKFTIGTPDEVLRSEVLSELYGTPVEVVRVGGRVIVAGTPHGDHHHEEESE